MGSWLQNGCERVAATYRDGRTEVYLPFHSYHIRRFYTPAQVDGYNENALGFGVGKGLNDEDGDWHGLYAMVFRDSHFDPEPFAGYGYQTFWHPGADIKLGLGYTVFLTARKDIGNYVPIPGILPLASVQYKKASLMGSYVPGGRGNGNVLFFFGRFEF